MGTINDALARLHMIGGESLVERMTASFLDNATRRIDAARTAVRAGDFAGLERAAHSLKSSAGNVGAAELMRRSAEIEELAAAGDPRRLSALVGELPEIFRGVGERLGKRRAVSL